MKNESRPSRSVVFLALLAAGLGLGFSCDKSINDSTVSVLVTVRSSLGDNNQQSGGDAVSLDSRVVSISADGRYIAFATKAPNLVAGDNNGAVDVFLRDMVTRTTALVSVNRFGTGTGDGASSAPTISADGRYVAFRSAATNLHADDPDTTGDIYVRDVVAGTTLLVSRFSGPAGDKANGVCENPMISTDGRYVTFDSRATNLDGTDVPGDTDSDTAADIYRRELTGFLLTELVSRRSLAVDNVKGNAASRAPRISGDGRYIVFESDATNLVTNAAEGGPDGNPATDCFVRDMDTDFTRRVSLTLAGGNPNGVCTTPFISNDGRFVVFRSLASNLHPDDDGPEPDIFLFDTTTLNILIVSQHTFGTQAGQGCDVPVLTGDGQFVVFQSPSPSLVNGDTNTSIDIFRHNRLTRETERMSVSTYGLELNGNSQRPAVTTDGSYVVFVTDATNAADDDTNGAVDVYLRGPPR
ncbi:MAG TPA: hypothetical protein VF950_29655 [Planctomycetota bacterium]